MPNKDSLVNRLVLNDESEKNTISNLDVETPDVEPLEVSLDALWPKG